MSESATYTHLCWRCGAVFTSTEPRVGQLCPDCRGADRAKPDTWYRESLLSAKREAELRRRDEEYAKHAPRVAVTEENGVRTERRGCIPAGANARSREGLGRA